MKELVASLSSEGFSSVCAHRCRHRRKMNLGLGRRQGLQSVKRRGGNSWAVLARAPPEPGGNRNPQNSHSVWTRREGGKTCPKLRRTHWERKEHFCWEKPPKPTTASHLQTPKPTTVSHCPQGTLLSPRSGCGRACRPHGQMGGRAQHFQPGNGTEARKRRRVQGRQHYGKHPPALRSPQEGDKAPPASAALGSLGLQQRRQHKEGIVQGAPEPARAVEQPALTKALVRGAGTAEEDPSEQKAHQDGTGEEEERKAQAGTGGSSFGRIHACLVRVCLQFFCVQGTC